MRLERFSVAFAGLLPSFVAIIHLLEFDLIFYFAISGRANLVRRCLVAGVRQVYHLRPICGPLRALLQMRPKLSGPSRRLSSTPVNAT